MGNFDNERNERWVAASLGLERIERFMIPVVQGLGVLDCKLTSEDARFERLSEEEQGTIEERVMFTDRFALSSLWVMGAYELVRTLHERHKHDNIFAVGEVAECLKMLKGPMDRLRMPLAKMQPANMHSNTDYPIPQQFIMPGYGIAWRVSEDKLISRRWLSDGLLGLVELIQVDAKVQAQQEGSSDTT